MKKINATDFMSDFGITKISESIPVGGEIVFTRLSNLILIKNISVGNDVGIYASSSSGIIEINGVRGVSINDNSPAWLQIKIDSTFGLKLINNRNAAISIRGILFTI